MRAQLEGKEREILNLKGKIESLEASSQEQFWGRSLGPIRSQGGRSSEYSKEMKTACLQVLSRGIECTHLHAVLHFIAKGMKHDPSVVPSLPTLNRWRDQDLRINVDRQLASFVTSATQLTLCLDCSAYSTYKYSAIGLTNEDGLFMLLDVIRSHAKTGLDLKKQVIERLHASGLFNEIVIRLRDILSGTYLNEKTT